MTLATKKLKQKLKKKNKKNSNYDIYILQQYILAQNIFYKTV